jgi:signal transduction histidine kinase
VDDVRARTTLFCGVIAFAIALSMVLRGRRTLHLLYAAFATDVAFWYGSQSLAGLLRNTFWAHATSVLTVLLPQFAVHLFEAVVPEEPQAPPSVPASASGAAARLNLKRFATFALAPAVALAISPYHDRPLGLAAIYLYVVGLLSAALVSLWRRGQRSPSRQVRDRVRFLVGVGALAMTLTLADFVIRSYLPPIGAVISTVFLFVLAESLTRPRLAYLYEMVGRLLVATVLAFSLAGIFYAFVTYLGRWGEMYLNAVLAAIVFLVLFEPLQGEVEKRIHQFFFRERYDLETSVVDLRRRLSHVLELEEMAETVLSGLERSRRITSCAVYLRDQDGNGFDLAGSLGAAPPRRLEMLAMRPIVDKLRDTTALSLEEVARDVKEANAPIATAASSLGEYRGSVVLGIKGDDDEVLGILALMDERVRDAFTPEELALLETVAAQMGVAIANSRVYSRMKERDRLAALGAMAAGLAHEVKNPLGAIKGAAQLLEDMPAGDPSSTEFLGIILEETNRLNRVVGSFLDYARPHAGNPIPLDINAAVKRTVQILQSQFSDEVDVRLQLAEGLPHAKIDPEKFRQVLINLVQNAVQAMNGRGRVTIATSAGRAPRVKPAGDRPPPSDRSGGAPKDDESVEISVHDTGPGISQKVLKNLFVPFFTTKDKGTGLGLAISQSIVQNAGGSIEVVSSAAGTTFKIVLPGARESLMTPLPKPAAQEPEPAPATQRAATRGG